MYFWCSKWLLTGLVIFFSSSAVQSKVNNIKNDNERNVKCIKINKSFLFGIIFRYSFLVVLLLQSRLVFEVLWKYFNNEMRNKNSCNEL